MKTTKILALAGVSILATAAFFGIHIDDPNNLALFLGEAAALSAADVKKLTDALAETATKFNAKSDELSKKAEDAMKEIKDKGALLTETKAAVDKLLVEHTTLTGEKNKLTAQVAEAEARLTGVEQEVARKAGAPASRVRKSIGAQLVEDEKFKAWIGGRGDNAKGRHRFQVNAAITSVDFPVSEPGINFPEVRPGTLPLLQQRLFVRDLLSVGQTSKPAIAWVQVTGFTNAARVVSEGTAKPESTISYDVVMTPVATIAHIFKASKQILDDFAQLRTDIDRELRYGLKQAEEHEILFGDGTGIHLNGLVTQATAFSAAFEPAAHQRIDDIRLAILQSTLARIPASGIVLHHTDWAHIELTKDANGQYLFANPLRLAGNSLWGLPVVATEDNGFDGQFLTGPFQGGAQIYDREEINVEIATENEDDFVKNMVTIRCEERLALAVFRPEGFIWGAFAAGSGT